MLCEELKGKLRAAMLQELSLTYFKIPSAILLSVMKTEHHTSPVLTSVVLQAFIVLRHQNEIRS